MVLQLLKTVSVLKVKSVYSMAHMVKFGCLALAYDVTGQLTSYDATDVLDIGTNINFGNLGFTAYYYSGEGNGWSSH